VRVSKNDEKGTNLFATRNSKNHNFNLWLLKAAKNAHQTMRNLLLTRTNSKKNMLLKTFNMFLRILILYES